MIIWNDSAGGDAVNIDRFVRCNVVVGGRCRVAPAVEVSDEEMDRSRDKKHHSENNSHEYKARSEVGG